MNHSPVSYNRRVIMSVFAVFGIPESLIDLGSGDGAMVHLARAIGVRAVGVDLEAYMPDVKYDLTKPLDLGVKADMILCIETAEHIPENGIETFARNIERHRKHDTVFVFSAALPGQGGEGHVTMKPPVWWRDLFYRIGGWSYRPEETAKLQLVLTHTAGPMSNWLVPNVQVF